MCGSSATYAPEAPSEKSTTKYQYAIKDLTQDDAFTRENPYITGTPSFGFYWGSRLDKAVLFETAADAEQAIAVRNAVQKNSPPFIVIHGYGDYLGRFIVVPVKVIATTVTHTRVTESRELA